MRKSSLSRTIFCQSTSTNSTSYIKKQKSSKGGRHTTFFIATLITSSKHKYEFSSDLCKDLIETAILLRKLEKQYHRSFLARHNKEHMPSESTLQKGDVGTNCDFVMRITNETIHETYFNSAKLSNGASDMDRENLRENNTSSSC